MIHTISIISDTTQQSGGGAGSVIGSLVGYLITAIALYGVFKKAGEPAWAAFVPFYNTFILVRIAGYNPWMFLLFLIPIVNVVFAIVVALGVGRAFNRGALFSIVLLWLLSVIGFFIVGYGSATYVGPGGRREASV